MSLQPLEQFDSRGPPMLTFAEIGCQLACTRTRPLGTVGHIKPMFDNESLQPSSATANANSLCYAFALAMPLSVCVLPCSHPLSLSLLFHEVLFQIPKGSQRLVLVGAMVLAAAKLHVCPVHPTPTRSNADDEEDACSSRGTEVTSK